MKSYLILSLIVTFSFCLLLLPSDSFANSFYCHTQNSQGKWITEWCVPSGTTLSGTLETDKPFYQTNTMGEIFFSGFSTCNNPRIFFFDEYRNMLGDPVNANPIDAISYEGSIVYNYMSEGEYFIEASCNEGRVKTFKEVIFKNSIEKKSDIETDTVKPTNSEINSQIDSTVANSVPVEEKKYNHDFIPESTTQSTTQKNSDEPEFEEYVDPRFVKVEIISTRPWKGAIGNVGSISSVSGSNSRTYLIECDGIVSANAQMYSDSGYLSIWLEQNGKTLEMSSTISPYGVVSISSTCSPYGLGGGCLIATATFDSELAPQVQKLREIRDSKLLQTESGSQFMEHFNSFYYSFSPYIADYERENPVFKEIVKIGITPMISTLSLMDYADTESEVLGIGISLIILNAMMYVGLPVFGIMRLRK
jgi:hypothetical protein